MKYVAGKVISRRSRKLSGVIVQQGSQEHCPDIMIIDQASKKGVVCVIEQALHVVASVGVSPEEMVVP